jgi:hypothetical protein
MRRRQKLTPTAYPIWGPESSARKVAISVTAATV